MGREAGITFCFAAAFHPALRHASVARRELGIRTTFNFLGPLAHPAKPEAQAIGCADTRMAPLMAGVFARRGVDAWVFRGDDGLDELTTTTTSHVWAVSGGLVEEFVVDPDDFGLGGGTAEGLRGQDAAYNADVVRRLLAGEIGQVRNAVVLNAAAALAVHAGENESPKQRLVTGIARAQESLDSGAAAERSRPMGRGQRRSRLIGRAALTLALRSINWAVHPAQHVPVDPTGGAVAKVE